MRGTARQSFCFDLAQTRRSAATVMRNIKERRRRRKRDADDSLTETEIQDNKAAMICG